MDGIKNKIKPIIVFLGLAVLILWQMLKPGYVLALDMIFASKIKIFLSEGAFYNALPVRYLMKFLNILMDGWLIQKIMLVVLFFLLGYLAYRFMLLPDKYHARYWAGLFYAVNPFVYERFLAGHWTHLFAYAFLPPFIYYLVKLREEMSWRNTGLLFLWIFLIGLFSMHFLTIAILILIIYFPILFISKLKKDKRQAFELFKKVFVFGFIFLILSSYWIVPQILQRDRSVINTFTESNWEAFKTAGDESLGTSLNVLSLYGFWGERENWAKYFIWPKDNFIFWSIIASLLFIIIIIGIISGFKDRKNIKKTRLFIILGVFGFIFSCGTGDTLFKSFNLWFFENIGFWSGFRDSQKWSGLLVLAYAYFGGIGLIAITDYLKQKQFKYTKQILVIIFLVPVFYTYTMIGGFARQLQSVWYPNDWHEINDILNKDKENNKVLFLPWHLYMSLDFNNNLISANPARSFFDKEIIQGENMEVGGVFSQTSNKANQEIEDIILDEKLNPDEVIGLLVKRNIKYIINYNYLTEKDYLKYGFLESGRLKKIGGKNLTLFEIMVY